MTRLVAIVGATLLMFAVTGLIAVVALQSVSLDVASSIDALDWRSAPARLPSSCC